MMTDRPQIKGSGSFLEGLLVQHRVLRALILRELQSRYGRENIGYLWVIAEPLMLASVITMLHFLVEKGTMPGGIGPYPFTLLGYCLFIIFRNSFNRSTSVLHASGPMLYHLQITPLDLLLSSAIVEAIACLSALTILMALGVLAGVAELPARPLYVFGAVAAITAVTFGMSLVVAAHTYDNHVLERFVHPFSYFMFPLSGAFVTMSFLPPWARELMAYNPFMSIFEMARYGYFAGASHKYVDISFVIVTCAAVNYWGLVSLRRMRNKIHAA